MEASERCLLNKFPSIGQPGREIVVGRSRQAGEQLDEIELGIDVVPAAGGGETGEDGGRFSAARVADEEAILSV